MISNITELKESIANGEKVEYLFFWGHKGKNVNRTGAFSQWYDGDSFKHGAFVYPTAEHYMMHRKACLFEDFKTGDKILAADHPKDAKRFGREVKNFDPKVWDEHKFNIVREGNICKFMQNRALMDVLVSTGDKVLVEASPYDRIWGIGLSVRDNSDIISNCNKWRGENLLGFALMQVRDVCRKSYE
jgi:ribA/ribD-fused uncharacterized protein